MPKEQEIDKEKLSYEFPWAHMAVDLRQDI